MPPWGPVLGEQGTKDVAHYVMSLSGMAADSIRVARGKPLFAQNCVACHGAEGKGNQAMGAPNLTDKIWLYSAAEPVIIETIVKGRNEPDADAQDDPHAGKDPPAGGLRLFSVAEPVIRPGRCERAFPERGEKRQTGWCAARAGADGARDGERRHDERAALRRGGEDLSARGARLVRGLALGAGLGSRSWCSTAARG